MTADPIRLVVGVGASAGGLEAFKQLLGVLPDDSGMAFLFVQHLDPDHESLLTQLLERHSRMVVREAAHGEELRPNHVYVIPPDTAMAVQAGRIELTPPVLQRGIRLPVDHLFRSLAETDASRAAGIVLSGAGSDGTAGLRQLMAAGGLTIAQAPDSTTQAGMPRSAISAGVAEMVLEIPAMPEALARFAALPPEARAAEPPAGEEAAVDLPDLGDEDVARLAALLEAHAGFDLKVYKRATIQRRVFRRMGLSGFARFEEFLAHLRDEPSARETVVRDMLISVTEFFRDPEVFDTLRERVIEPLVAEADRGSTLRIWVPGCATGEEAYSIAIEVLDAIGQVRKDLTLQLFATDVDQEALAVARAGIYPASIAESIPEPRLAEYFRPIEGRGYEVVGSLRDLLSFAVHDLTRDPPFSRMSLVSCRNVLIYLNRETQQRVLGSLHFALASGGYLLMSTSESPGSSRKRFKTVSKKHRIYQKVGRSQPLDLPRGRQRPDRTEAGDLEATEPDSARPVQQPHDLARRAVLDACVPPCVIVSLEGAVLFMHGDLNPYLQFPQGEEPKLELATLLRPAIAARVRGVMYRSRRKGELVEAESTLDDESQERVRISAIPVDAMGEGAVMLSFKAIEAQRSPEEQAAESADGSVIEQLEDELDATREDLRNTVEELESANEELRSSNEEAMSMNEELQSANEELEATSEELRSVNEELTTVNAQLRDKVEQVERAHNDLSNFFASTRVATIFLDEDLRIERVTPAAQELLMLDSTNMGARAGDVARELLQQGLESEAQQVLEHLAPQSREIETEDGRWIVRSLLPYRTANRRIEGVVVTFTDITDLKAATRRLELRERQQSIVARLGILALQEAELENFMERVVREVQRTLDTDYCKILELQPGGERLLLRWGVGWNEDDSGAVYVSSGPESQAGYTLQSPNEAVIVHDLAREKRFSGPPLLTEHEVTSGISCVIQDRTQPYGVLGAHTRERREFTREDATFLQAVATVLGGAISRFHTRTRLAIELCVARSLADAAGLDTALKGVFDCLARDLGVTVGEVWWRSARDAVMERRAIYLTAIADPEKRNEVESRLTAPGFGRGEGLVGTVFEQGESIWVTDLGDPGVFVRREQAARLGLHSGFGLPILMGEEVVGVFTLLSSERLFADDTLLRSLDGIGRSIGHLATRIEFEQRARRLAAITASSHDAILSYDFDHIVTDWLPGARRLFGYTAEEMVGEPITRIVPADREEELHRMTERVRRGEVVQPLETVRLRKDGTPVEVSVRKSPIIDHTDTVVGVASTDRDITERKDYERRLIEADRQKDQFLAMLGHELRNPLSAIQSATELLELEEAASPRLERMNQILSRQTEVMATLIDGLLDVSRIIRGKIRLEADVVDLVSITRESVEDLLSRSPDRATDFELALPDSAVHVKGDRVRLTQIIDNLLSNAVKFTGPGDAITVSVSRDGALAELSVRDAGVGIPPDLLPYIFDVFRQSEQNLDRSAGGLGLGLALVKSLVELHHGNVNARSEGEGTGATFVVTLPLARETRRPVDPKSAPSIPPMNILLVEDNQALATVLAELLENVGHSVTVAGDGHEGLEREAGTSVDLVLCDLGLPPPLNGFDVARAIVDRSGSDRPILIAISGYGRQDYHARAEESGFDAYLTKPVRVDALNRALTEVMARRARRD